MEVEERVNGRVERRVDERVEERVENSGDERVEERVEKEKIQTCKRAEKNVVGKSGQAVEDCG